MCDPVQARRAAVEFQRAGDDSGRARGQLHCGHFVEREPTRGGDVAGCAERAPDEFTQVIDDHVMELDADLCLFGVGPGDGEAGRGLVHRHDVGAGALRFLDPSTDYDNYPEWSPDGRDIAFIRIPSSGLRQPRRPRRLDSAQSAYQTSTPVLTRMASAPPCTASC